MAPAACSSCGGDGGKKARPARATTTIDYGAQYVALANEANDAAERFNTAAAKLTTKGITQQQLAAEASTFADALADMNSGLTRASWPPKVAALVPDLARANEKVIADLRRTASVPPGELAAWNHEVAVDEGRFTEAAIRIRLELRLPPAEA